MLWLKGSADIANKPSCPPKKRCPKKVHETQELKQKLMHRSRKDREIMSRKSCQGVSTVDDEIGSGRECAGIAGEVDDSSLEILWFTDSSHGGKVFPVLAKGWVAVQDGAGEAANDVHHLACDHISGRSDGGLRSEHVTGGDAVHANLLGGPLDSERGGHVPDGSFGGVVGRPERRTSNVSERTDVSELKVTHCG